MTSIRLIVTGWHPAVRFYWVLLLILTTALLNACESEPEQDEQSPTGAEIGEAEGSANSQRRASIQPNISDVSDQVTQDNPQSVDALDADLQASANGICDRHEHIRGEILWWLDKDDCADVSDADLASIDGTLHLHDHYTFTSLDAGDLRGLSSLEGLFMSFDMSALPAGVFDDLTSLRELRLYADGSRPRLPPGLFDRLTGLEGLILQTGYLDRGAFSETPRLRKLWLLGGGLTGVNISHLRRLEELVVSGWVPRLEADTLAGLSGLHLLDIDDMGISEIDPDAFRDLKSLSFLNLRNNQLTTLPAGVFDSLTSLEELWLYGNPLTALTPGLFSRLTNLTELFLGTGVMTSLEPGTFEGLTSLRWLDVRGELLSELPPGLLQPLSSLTRLDISVGESSGMPPDLFLGLKHLTSVSFWAYGLEWPQLTVELRRITSDSFAVNVAEAAPFATTVRLEAEGGALSTPTVTVPAGETSSEVVRVTPSGDSPARISVASWSFPANYTFEGFLVPPPELWEPLIFTFE